jgi:glycosyltransferase A (GT-A) superfamily protein (DUF2064 family)
MSNESKKATDPRVARDERQAVLADAIGDDIRSAIEANLPSAAIALVAEEDVIAVVHAVVDELDQRGLTFVNRERLAAYLMTHIGGDESRPWQAGHNYAMTEAARLVRDGWDRLMASAPATEEDA